MGSPPIAAVPPPPVVHLTAELESAFIKDLFRLGQMMGMAASRGVPQDLPAVR